MPELLWRVGEAVWRPAPAIVPRDERDAYVCAVALRAGIAVEVCGLWGLRLDGRRRVFQRLPAAVRAAVEMPRVELNRLVADGTRIIGAITAALKDLYGDG